MVKPSSGAMHVARIVTHRGKHEYVAHLLRQSYREGAKVKNRTLANLSALPPAAIEAVRRALAGELLVSAQEALTIERSWAHGHMDWLLERQELIEQRLAERYLAPGEVVLYDLSSTYVEGEHCPLAKRGFSRDGRPDKAQVEFGLLTNAAGDPIAIEAFAGNTADPTTFQGQVQKVKQRLGVAELVWVADRGMLTHVGGD